MLYGYIVLQCGTKIRTVSFGHYVETEAYSPKGTVKIWIATSNNFKEGAEDKYALLGETTAGDEYFAVPFKNKNAELYKKVIEGAYNTVNKWLVMNVKKGK